MPTSGLGQAQTSKIGFDPDLTVDFSPVLRPVPRRAPQRLVAAAAGALGATVNDLVTTAAIAAHEALKEPALV